MARLHLFALCIVICSAYNAAGQSILGSFHALEFDSVAVYGLAKFNCKSEVASPTSINSCYKFYQSIAPDRVNMFFRIVGDTNTFKGMYLSCGIPNLGFVFFENGKIAGYVSIDVECGYISFSHNVAALEKYKISAGTDGYFIYPTLSEAGREDFNKFFSNVGLDCRIETNTVRGRRLGTVRTR